MERVEMFDFNACKNMLAVKAKAREIMLKVTYDAYCEAFGEENVSMVVTDDKGTMEVAVALGTITDSDGFTVDVCTTSKPTAKDYELRRTSKGKIIEMFDRKKAAKAYDVLVSDRKKKAEQAEKEKKEKEAKQAKKTAEKTDTPKMEAMAEVGEKLPKQVESASFKPTSIGGMMVARMVQQYQKDNENKD